MLRPSSFRQKDKMFHYLCFFLFCIQGGLKAVIWTDVFQSTIMVAGLIVVVIVGSIEVGGFGEVWRINKEFDRLNFFE